MDAASYGDSIHQTKRAKTSIRSRDLVLRTTVNPPRSSSRSTLSIPRDAPAVRSTVDLWVLKGFYLTRRDSGSRGTGSHCKTRP